LQVTKTNHEGGGNNSGKRNYWVCNLFDEVLITPVLFIPFFWKIIIQELLKTYKLSYLLPDFKEMTKENHEGSGKNEDEWNYWFCNLLNEVFSKSDVRLTVHRNSVWIRKTNWVSLFVFFISLLIVAQHVSGNHVPIIRSWQLRDVIAFVGMCRGCTN